MLLKLRTKLSKRVKVTFKKLVLKNGSNTVYGALSLYKYPAKFIPHVVTFVLKKYAKSGMKIFDPFAGYGTVGLISRIYGYDYELWDLNPLINMIHKTSLIKKSNVDIPGLIDEIKNSKKEFVPDWSNLDYWFDKRTIPILSQSWGFVNSLTDNELRHILLIPLLKTTRHFSYSDDNMYKLYKSKYSIKKMEAILGNDWKSNFYHKLEREIYALLRRLNEYRSLQPRTVKFKIRSGKDILGANLDNNVDILITSPPYLQAQEYIRSTKLELFWLGYKESQIKEFSSKEIPYREVDRIEIYSEKYYKFRKRIEEAHLKRLYDRYFHAILNIFSALSKNVKNYMFIFVGPAKVRTLSIPIDAIIVEHLSKLGWKHEATYIDKILSRSIFKTNINAASGIKDGRIKTEHLVVLKKES